MTSELNMNRRDFLFSSGGGLGGIALAAMLGDPTDDLRFRLPGIAVADAYLRRPDEIEKLGEQTN